MQEKRQSLMHSSYVPPYYQTLCRAFDSLLSRYGWKEDYKGKLPQTSLDILQNEHAAIDFVKSFLTAVIENQKGISNVELLLKEAWKVQENSMIKSVLPAFSISNGKVEIARVVCSVGATNGQGLSTWKKLSSQEESLLLNLQDYVLLANGNSIELESATGEQCLFVFSIIVDQLCGGKEVDEIFTSFKEWSEDTTVLCLENFIVPLTSISTVDLLIKGFIKNLLEKSPEFEAFQVKQLEAHWRDDKDCVPYNASSLYDWKTINGTLIEPCWPTISRKIGWAQEPTLIIPVSCFSNSFGQKIELTTREKPAIIIWPKNARYYNLCLGARHCDDAIKLLHDTTMQLD